MIKLFFVPFLVLFSLSAASAPDASLKKLVEGNNRYVNSKSQSIDNLKKKRSTLLSSQSPFATIIGCSDSRVPPEIIFDQSLGDLFVVRVAGNVAGPLELDSIEYAADQLACPLVLVLGHQGCGAVKAVLEGGVSSIDLENVIPFIQQAVDQSRNLPGDPLTNAIMTNIKLNKQLLENNPVLKKLVKNNKLKIFGGYYDLQSGKVTIID
jgi:carbonic anhydrase